MVYFSKQQALKLIDLFMEYDYEEYSYGWKEIIDKCLEANDLKPWSFKNGIIMCEKKELIK